MEVFKDFNRVGVTTVIASHDDTLMASYATRAFKVEPGKFADSASQRAPTYTQSAVMVTSQSPTLRATPDDALR